MKIAILGTRGIPNNYSDLNNLQSFFSVYLVENGMRFMFIILTIIYFKKRHLKVNIHQNDPEYKIALLDNLFMILIALWTRKEILILYCNWAIRATQYGSSIAQNQLS
jgi:hypothetical protein